MTQTMAREIRVEKIDLDTAGAAFLLGVSRDDKVKIIRGQISFEDLANPNVICIEVGGSGQVDLNNWDHHKEGEPKDSATMQTFFYLYSNNIAEAASKARISESCIVGHHCFGANCMWECSRFWPDEALKTERLVRYINQLDVEGPHSLPLYGKLKFPALSDVFAGMLLTERNSIEQLHKGIELFRTVVESKQDPFGTIRGFDSYAKAKAENNRQVAKAVKDVQWKTTFSGLRLGCLETKFYGAVGALYGIGAQVVVALNPDFNGVRKFTVAGNDVRVEICKDRLNALEPGWGGPPTGTIIGSSREGSKLSLEQVVKIASIVL